jgi:hypothetical protein
VSDLGYTKSLIVIFIIPFLVLLRPMLHTLERKPFALAISAVCLLGWAWSTFLSYKGWWIFPGNDIVGVYILPHLPLEEFVIYPIGGALSIYSYTRLSQMLDATPQPRLLWASLLGITAVFGSLAVLHSETQPFYLISQLALYNTLCLVLALFTSASLKMSGLVATIALLGSVGFVWDYLAFTRDWWIYTATMGLKWGPVPVEDINFYVLAPTAAILLYVFFCNLHSPASSHRRREYFLNGPN